MMDATLAVVCISHEEEVEVMLCREQPQGSFGVVLGCQIFAIIIIFVVHPANAAATTTTALMITFLIVNSFIILGAMGPEFQRLLCQEEGRRVASHQMPFFVRRHRPVKSCAQFLVSDDIIPIPM